MFKRTAIPTFEAPFAIEARNLGIVIDGRPLVQDVNLRIEPCEYVALKGPSGSGKSLTATALYDLTVDNKPPIGEVWYGDPDNGGIDIYKGLDDEARTEFVGHHVGFVSQSALLDPKLTMDQIIRRILAYKDEPYDAKHVAGMVALLGMSSKMHEKTGALSGGEKQRGSIILALAHKPLALIMDEPTSALDAEAKDTVNELLTDLSDKTGNTILVVTHEDTSAKRIIEMDSGRIVTGTSVNVPQSDILNRE
jgi:ABC-type lipoprotein export system ATPase subunit